MYRKNNNPAGVTTPRSECPYGKKPEIGIFLALICVLKAILPILERFFSQSFSKNGLGYGFALFSTLLTVWFLISTIFALRASDSPAIKIGFAFCILAGVAQSLYSILILYEIDGLYLSAGLTLFSSMMLTAGFLVFSICRDHTRETARTSAAVAILFIPHTILTGILYLSAWNILQGFTVPWVRLLKLGSAVYLFSNILLWLISAVMFLFMRTDVPNARYPARLIYESFPDMPDSEHK